MGTIAVRDAPALWIALTPSGEFVALGKTLDEAVLAIRRRAEQTGVNGVYRVVNNNPFHEVEAMGFSVQGGVPNSAGTISVPTSIPQVPADGVATFVVSRLGGEANGVSVAWQASVTSGVVTPASGTLAFEPGEVGGKPVQVTLSGVTEQGSITFLVTGATVTIGGGQVTYGNLTTTAPVAAPDPQGFAWITSVPDQNLTVGIPYSQSLQDYLTEPAVSIDLIAGQLPAGLSINPTTKIVSGTPTAAFPRAPVTFRASNTVPPPGGGPPGDADADWAARSQAAAVFYAENFSSYATDAALAAAGDYGSRPPLDLGSYHLYTGGSPGPGVVSGGKALEIRTYDRAGQNGGTWRMNPISSGPVRNGFYFQFHVAYDRAGLAWRTNGGNGELKTVFIGVNGPGQLLVNNINRQGFPSLFVDGASGTNITRNTSLDFHRQTAIDAGGPTPTTYIEGIRRYGCARSISNGPALNDYSYVAGDAAANYLDNRGFSFPNADAIFAGSQPYLIDQWLVIEVYYEQTTDPVYDKLYMWAAPRGAAPKRISGTWPLTGGGVHNRTKMGRSSQYNVGGISMIQLTNYDTPRVSEIGYRPVMKTYFAEVICSHEWIPFPGHLTTPEP